MSSEKQALLGDNSSGGSGVNANNTKGGTRVSSKLYSYDADLEAGVGTYIADYVDRNEAQIRLGFVRKVYSILCSQLLVSLLFIMVTVTHENVRLFVQHNVGLQFCAVIVAFAVIIMIVCTSMGKQYPTNMYLLTAFTMAESYLLAVAVSVYPTTAVVQAVGITAGVTLGLTAYTWSTDRDFSSMGTYLYCALLVMVFGGIVRMFFPAMPMVDTLWAMAGALLFSLYIVYDTFLLLKKLGPDDYVFAALNLYLDIINLFLYILKLVSKRD